MSLPRFRPAQAAMPLPPAIVMPPVASRPAYRSHVKPGRAFIASPQQQGFFDWITSGTGNAMVQAVAGAGKTTTLCHGLGLMTGQIFFGAYNRKIADEIKTKAAELGVSGPNVFITTMHGYGYTNWRRGNKEVVVDDRKVGKIIEACAEGDPAYKMAETFIGKMVSFGKQFLIGVKGKTLIENFEAWTAIALHFGVEQELPGADLEDGGMTMLDALKLTIDVYRKSILTCHKTIDFDDMIFAPLFYQTKLFLNDWVLLDECQDINPARRELARRMLKPGGRFVAVGDDRQAIYGFTGAGGDSVQKIIEEFKCSLLPLTVTYRCPKAVVAYVHQWVSHIQAHENAPEGVVRGPALAAPVEGTSPLPWFVQDRPSVNDAVICRYTAPLVQTAFAMIKNGIGCKVEGRDIGKGLIVLATRWNIVSLDKLEERLTAWLKNEVTKAQAEKSDRKAQDAQDKVACLQIFILRCREKQMTKIADLVKDIEKLFADDVSGVIVLSTIHKAKGREWPRVYWLQAAQRMRAMKEWEAMQELNMNYVAGTRAQAELILVPEKQL